MRGLERRRLGGFAQATPYLVGRRRSPSTRSTPRSPEADGLAHGGARRRQAGDRALARHPRRERRRSSTRSASRRAWPTSPRPTSTCRPRSAWRCSASSTWRERLARVLARCSTACEVFKVKEKIDTQVREEFSHAPARGGAAPEAEGDPGGARRGRRRRGPRRVRREDQGGRHADGGREDRAQAARAPEAACRRRRPSTPSRAPTSSGWSSCRGPSAPTDRLDLAEARDDPRRRSLRPARR